LNRARPRRSVLLLLCWGYCALNLAGCELFSQSSAKLANVEAGLPSLPIPPDSMQLEILFVERPVGDRLMGDPLWKEVDTNLNMEPEEQRDLARNGFLIGVAGAHPPAALQQLLEMRAKPKEGEIATGPETDGRLQGNRFFLQSGAETQIQLNDVPHEELQFNLFATHAARDPSAKTYKGARCIYRVTVKREQRGWARLDFVPEIHYGMDVLRPAAGADNWELKSQQNIEKLYAQRFTVILNTGDMVLVTGRSDLTGTAGHRFFTGPEGQDGIQRMLIVRLSQMAANDLPRVTVSRLTDE
jgi:hypothetical protein